MTEGAVPHRVGLIVPSSNVTIETELPRLLAGHAAAVAKSFSFHSSRAVLHRVDPGSLRAMVGEVDRSASELADARVDVVAYGCLIALMTGGAGAHEAAEERIAATLSAGGCDAPVTSSAGALVRCLQRLGAERISIITPYMRPLTAVVVEYLRAYGIDVISSMSLEVDDNVAVGRLDPSRLPALAERLEIGRSDAVVLSACVQMPSLPVIQEAENRLGRPVLSAATATAGEILSALGEQAVVDGAGAALSARAAAGASTTARSG